MVAGKALATLFFVMLTVTAIVSHLVANDHIKIEPKAAHTECNAPKSDDQNVADESHCNGGEVEYDYEDYGE